MGIVYRYRDKRDDIIKYVGIVYGRDRTLKQRIKEHEKDDWYNKSEWIIEYISANIDNRTDAEYFESHYISLYRTDRYYNKSKAGWGISNYLPDREKDWECYEYSAFQEYGDALDMVKKILSYKTYSERKSFFMSMTRNISCYSDSKIYKDELNAQLNILLFNKPTYIARFNGYGEIYIKFPHYQEIKYNDSNKTFISPFDQQEIKTENFEKYLQDRFDLIKQSAEIIIKELI